MLTPVDSFWLRWHADHSPEPDARRARILLLADRGAPAGAIASAMGVSAFEAVRAVGQFTRRRLSDFPRPSLSPDELLSATHTDLGHARHVAVLATALFDFTRSLHKLPARLRGVLEVAALLHNVGLTVDELNHHTAGRDLLRAMDLSGWKPAEQKLIACAVGFHRKKVNPADDKGFAALTPGQRRQALALAALLRVADGLDYSQNQSTQLRGVIMMPGAVTLRLEGPEAEGDAARARKKADLWREVFHLQLETAVAIEPTDLAKLATLRLTPETLMSDVARRALAQHLRRWQANESAALAGDPPAVKAVRVSARRLRAALDAFGVYFKKKPVKVLTSTLRELETLLGDVRNMDVLLADANAYLAGLAPEAKANDLRPLLTVWEKERQRALTQAEHWLGAPAASDLQTALLNFIAAPPVKDDEPLRTGAGIALRAMVAVAGEQQARVNSGKPKSYHRLRLALKNVRYTLEFLSPALDPQVKDVIADLVRAQDRLGALNDARQLARHLSRFLDAWAEQQAKRKAPQLHGAQAILQYAHARQGLWEQRLAEFEADWGPVKVARLKQRVNMVLKAAKGQPPRTVAARPARPKPSKPVAAQETAPAPPAPEAPPAPQPVAQAVQPGEGAASEGGN